MASKKTTKKSTSKSKKVSPKKTVAKKTTKNKAKAKPKKAASKAKPKVKPAPKQKSKKSTSSKKTSTKSVRKSAPQNKIFVLVNGKKLKNIKELADVIADLEDYVFNHHVTADKNDFASWLEHVFEDIQLAKKIAGCTSKDHMQLVLYKHISHKLW